MFMGSSLCMRAHIKPIAPALQFGTYAHSIHAERFQMSRINSRSEMEAFVRSAELGGFSAAARELGLTPSALSKFVKRLEMRLGVPLLHRTTSSLSPTPEGEEDMQRCRRILDEMEAAEDEVAGGGEQPRGRLPRT